ncbi:MAG: sensor histidine kinase [Caulobacteraceae bacterium]|nr:sensor histidine kinase [Caulobacteraceae bacterium]
MLYAAHPVAASFAATPTAREVETDERRRSFLRMVSHELRTPLNSIIGFSEILGAELHGPLGAPQYREYAEIIRGSGYKLLKLVNQVLEIARLESGAMDLDLRPEPLDTALDDAIAGLQDEIATHGIRIVIVDRGALPSVVADGRGLRAVLGHLLQNAVHYSPEGGQVRVSAAPRGRNLDILIENDGPDVSPEDLARLLMPFEQGENALTRRGEGAGLGLPISQLTCQAMGGQLSLASAPGKGVSARIRLPRA